MPSYLFWLFATVMLIGGTAVIAFRNPVSSALSVVTCFVGLAGLFIGLSAFFVGVMWDPLESTCRHASLSIL